MDIFDREHTDRMKDEWNSFYSAVELYVYYRNSAKSVQEIIKQAVKVPLQMPFARSSSLFLMNQENYEFEHKTTYPSDQKSNVDELYKILLNTGTIGNTLQNATVNFYPANRNIEIDNHAVIIPLLVPTGVMGLLIVSFDFLPQDIDQALLNICLLFGNLFSSTLDNALLNKQLNQTREVLEQKVALRTMHLAQSKRELNAIFDSVHTGILVIDSATDIVIKANPVAAALIGLPENELVGSDARQYFDLEYDSIYAVSEGASLKNYESNLKRQNIGLLPILRTSSQVNIGNVKYKIETFIDISERKKSEVELKSANELLELKIKEKTRDLQLLVTKLQEEIHEKEKAKDEMESMFEKEKELNDLKSKFVSMVSHEFRTPLTIIRSSAQLIEKFYEKLSGEEKKDYLDRIVKTVDFMKDLIENVIFIGKTDTSKLSTNPTVINLAEFCRGLINDFQLTLNTKRIINFNYRSGASKITIDSKLLKHILINLLSNAIKYSPDDKAVDLEVSADNSHILFTIRDYGIGIPDDEQKNIFELFFRGRNVGNVSGTGLGMSVVERSVETLGGTIEFFSKVNLGTTFRVSIPIND